MRKVVSVEGGKTLAEKARKLIGKKPLRLLAAAIIVAITSSPVVKAEEPTQDMYVFFDASGNLVEGALPPEEYSEDIQSIYVDGNPEDTNAYVGTAKMDDAVKGTLLETLDAGFTWEYSAVEEPYYEEVQEQVQEELPDVVDEPIVEEVQPEVVENSTVQEESEFDFSTDLFDCLDEEETLQEEVENEVVEEVQEEPVETLEETIADNDELLRLDILVTDNYTGVAPLGFTGDKKVLRNYGDASNDEEVRERAQIIYDHFHNMNLKYGYLGIYNPYTYEEYTVEELMAIIKYINGAFIPTEDMSIPFVNDLWIAFMCSINSDPYLVEHVNYMKDYDNIESTSLITDQASTIFNNLVEYNESQGKLVVFNPKTNIDYSLEEIEYIVQYANGLFEPTVERDEEYITQLYDNFMNSIAVDSSLEQSVKLSFRLDSTVITEQNIREHENVLENLDLSILDMGDSANHPYKVWLAHRINEMYSSTDRKETKDIFDDTYLSVCSIMAGSGYAVDNVKYDLYDFDSVNDLVFLTEVLCSSELRNLAMNEGYILDNRDAGESEVYLTRVLEEFNPMCSSEIIEAIKSGNLPDYEGITEHEDGSPLMIKDFASVLQMKAFSASVANEEYGPRYYQERYLQKYPEYLQIKNGTYDGSLEEEPAFVYKKNN